MVDFAGGTGTALDPYLVATAEQLNEVRNNLNKHFKQTADISLAGYQAGYGWVSIGDSTLRFEGSYDGNGKQITDLKIQATSSDYQGLFGQIKYATIKNLGIKGPSINCHHCVGGLAGSIESSSVSNCYCEIDGISSYSKIGGFAGVIISSSVKGCYCKVINGISGTDCVGGFAGYFYSSSAENCYCVVESVSGGNYVGGFTGYIRYSSVENCYCESSGISGGTYVGGFAGEFEYSDNKISYCYCINKPNASGSPKDAFISKYGTGTITVTANFFDKTVAEIATSDYATGKTTAEMKTQSTFTDEGWNFDDVWYMPGDGGYPELRAYSPPTPPEKLKSNTISIFWGAL